MAVFPKTVDHLISGFYVPGTENDEGGLSWAEALQISEVMSSNRASYPDESSNYPDWVEIANISGIPINLEGVGLSDRKKRRLLSSRKLNCQLADMWWFFATRQINPILISPSTRGSRYPRLGKPSIYSPQIG